MGGDSRVTYARLVGVAPPTGLSPLARGWEEDVLQRSSSCSPAPARGGCRLRSCCCPVGPSVRLSRNDGWWGAAASAPDVSACRRMVGRLLASNPLITGQLLVGVCAVAGLLPPSAWCCRGWLIPPSAVTLQMGGSSTHFLRKVLLVSLRRRLLARR